MHILTHKNYRQQAKPSILLNLKNRSADVFKAILCTFIISLFSLSSSAFAVSEPIPYTAEYTGVFKGMNVTIKRELKKIGKNHYNISNSAKNSFAKFFESSDFYLFPSNNIQPKRYQYITQYGPIKKHEDVRFNWKTKVAKDQKSDKPNVTLSKNMADRISYQVLLRQLIKSGKKENITIDLYNRGHKGNYKFTVLPEVAISTPAGRFKAVPVKKIYADKSKSQTVWLAKDHDYILLRLLQKDKKGRYEINLSKLKLKK